MPMSMAYKTKLRFRRPGCFPRPNASPIIICPPTSTTTLAREAECKPSLMKGKVETSVVKDATETKKFRFARVDDRLFKVPEGFFLQMPLQVQESISFSSSRGLTPEKPIFLMHHSEDQFKQILSAYNAFPSLDAASFTLDHLLTVGELSIHYGLRDLVEWFFPAFRGLIIGPHSPLRTMTNVCYVRMMKLALRMKSLDLLGAMQSAWARRMHCGELSPVCALLFADVYGLRDLLGHACYAYLIGTHAKVAENENFNERGMLQPRQTLYIRAGFHSLRTYWNYLALRPPEFEKAPGCTLHSQCVLAWKHRWTTFLDRSFPFPEVDVLNRLGLMLERLKEDKILSACLSPPCRTLALKAVATKREQVSHHLHHHFDI